MAFIKVGELKRALADIPDDMDLLVGIELESGKREGGKREITLLESAGIELDPLGLGREFVLCAESRPLLCDDNALSDAAADFIERLARQRDRLERRFRRGGMFDAAVTQQYIASCIRARQNAYPIRGDSAKDLEIVLSDGKFWVIAGDMPRSELENVIIYLCQEAELLPPWERVRLALDVMPYVDVLREAAAALERVRDVQS